MSRGGPGTALFGLVTIGVLGFLHVVYYLLGAALLLIALTLYGIFRGVQWLFRARRKDREVEPRPVTPPVKPAPGPRDWSQHDDT